MKRRSLTSLGVVALSSFALSPELAAGPVSGNISRTGAKAADAAAVQIDVACVGDSDTPEKPAKPATSYKASAKMPGPYSLNVEEPGDCTLTVQYQGMTASIPIVSEKGAVRYDLVLSIVDGKLRVQRQ
jgi:hypothetical protein